MNRTIKLSILFLLLLGILFRVYLILTLPPNQDEQILVKGLMSIRPDNIPINFPAFGWGQDVLLAYLAAPFYFWLGIDPVYTFRVIALIFNVTLLLLIFTLSRKMFGIKTALIALFFASIWPWSRIAGSIGFSAYMAPSLLISGAWLINNYIQKKSYAFKVYLGVILIALAVYAYALSMIWIALLFVCGAIIYRKRNLSKHILISLTVFVTIVFPISIYQFSTNFGIPIPERIGVFSMPAIDDSRLNQLWELQEVDDLFMTPLQYVKNYTGHFNYFSLHANQLSNSNFMFLAYIWDSFFIYLGIYLIFRKRSKYKLIIAWLLLYPIASSLTIMDGEFSWTRDIIGLPVLIMLSAFGCASLGSFLYKSLQTLRLKKYQNKV